MVATEQEAKREDVIVLKPWYEECVKLIYSMTLYNDNLLVGRNVEHFVKVKMNLTLLLLCFLCKLWRMTFSLFYCWKQDFGFSSMTLWWFNVLNLLLIFTVSINSWKIQSPQARKLHPKQTVKNVGIRAKVVLSSIYSCIHSLRFVLSKCFWYMSSISYVACRLCFKSHCEIESCSRWILRFGKSMN